MDEIQIASMKEQSTYKSFRESNLSDKQQLYERDIKIVEYSATPNGTTYDLMNWNDDDTNNQSSKKRIGDEGGGYMSSQELLDLGRARQYEDLCGKDDDGDDDSNNYEEVVDNIRELKGCIETKFDPRDTKYHIIGTKLGSSHITTKSNINKIFGRDHYNYCSYHGNGDIDD